MRTRTSPRPSPRARASPRPASRAPVAAYETGLRSSDGLLEIRRPSSRRALSLRNVFLPEGYPGSVRPEYLRFQQYDTPQAACSYLRSILTTSAILRGAGVGEEAASPMAAALTWVFRDGVGLFGSLVFAYCVGANFDVNVKEWRLFADLINDVGLTLDMVAPLCGAWFAVVAALGASCKTACGLAAGATRASITSHFALENNLADVSAKESAQETLVTLVGLAAGASLAKALGDAPWTQWAAFIVLTVVHVWANARGVAALCFDTLNPQRASIVCRAWRRLRGHQPSRAIVRSQALAPAEASSRERCFGPLAARLFGPRLGAGIADLVRPASPGALADLRALERIYREEAYLLRLDASGRPVVAFKPAATDRDALKAVLHCAHWDGPWLGRKRPAAGLGPGEKQALTAALAETNRLWAEFGGALEASGWQRSALPLTSCFGDTRVVVK